MDSEEISFEDNALNELMVLYGTQRDCKEMGSILRALQKTQKSLILSRWVCSVGPCIWGLRSHVILRSCRKENSGVYNAQQYCGLVGVMTERIPSYKTGMSNPQNSRSPAHPSLSNNQILACSWQCLSWSHGMGRTQCSANFRAESFAQIDVYCLEMLVPLFLPLKRCHQPGMDIVKLEI